MKTDDFLNTLEGYYGEYPRPLLREYISLYLSEYTETELDVLLQELLLTYSGQYKHTPDIGIMEIKKAEINSRSALKKIGQKVKPPWLLEDLSRLTSGEINSELLEIKRKMEEKAKKG